MSWIWEVKFYNNQSNEIANLKWDWIEIESG
jgi:hypothetical protein